MSKRPYRVRCTLDPDNLRYWIDGVLASIEFYEKSTGWVFRLSQTQQPHRAEVSSFAVAFTRYVISWNALEDVARELVRGWSEGILVQGILANMNALSVQDALKNLSHQLEGGLFTLPEQNRQGELIAHFEKGMDRLRVRRNFYIHALRGMGTDPDDQTRFSAYFYALEGRGKLSFNEAKATSEEMMKFVRANSEFAEFGRNILRATKHPGRNALLGREPKLRLCEVTVPTLPPTLEKNKHFLGEERQR